MYLKYFGDILFNNDRIYCTMLQIDAHAWIRHHQSSASHVFPEFDLWLLWRKVSSNIVFSEAWRRMAIVCLTLWWFVTGHDGTCPWEVFNYAQYGIDQTLRASPAELSMKINSSTKLFFLIEMGDDIQAFTLLMLHFVDSVEMGRQVISRRNMPIIRKDYQQ